LPQAVTLLVSERVQTRTDKLMRVPLPPDDIEGLLGLEPGYSTRDEVMPLRLRVEHRDDGAEESQVVLFPGTNHRN
jgi:hypothetical protein